MAFEPWMLAAMEDAGMMDTDHGNNMKVAHYLAKYGSDDIGTAEFEAACDACGVDFGSVTESDLRDIQNKLNELT